MTAVNGISSNAYYELQRLQGGVAQNSVYQTEDGNLFNANGYAVSASGETCTDGKDDGKIGFGSALWNTIKGVGKTVVNGVKGMFTNKEGKFSLGKTLLSLGTAALCVAFPAVGLGLACVGAAAGAVQVGKGIYGAVTADTDAEAKEAWQNIGGGTFTVAVSVAGAKASYKAMKTSAGAESALTEYDTNGKLDFSKVKDNKMQYAKDLLHDAGKSTSNNFHKITSGISAKMAEFKSNRQNSKLTSEYDSLAQEATKSGKWENADAFKEKHPEIVEEYWQSGKGSEATLRDAVKSGDTTKINAQLEYMGESGQETALSIMKKATHSKNAAVSELAQKYVKTNAQPSEIASFFKALSQDMKTDGRINTLTTLGRQIYDQLCEGVSPDSLIAKFGYDNVIQVIETLVADENLINGDSI